MGYTHLTVKSKPFLPYHTSKPSLISSLSIAPTADESFNGYALFVIPQLKYLPFFQLFINKKTLLSLFFNLQVSEKSSVFCCCCCLVTIEILISSKAHISREKISAQKASFDWFLPFICYIGIKIRIGIYSKTCLLQICFIV